MTHERCRLHRYGWDERTNEDTVVVFADKAKADAAWSKLDGETVYGGVYRQTVKR